MTAPEITEARQRSARLACEEAELLLGRIAGSDMQHLYHTSAERHWENLQAHLSQLADVAPEERDYGLEQRVQFLIGRFEAVYGVEAR